MFLRSITGWIVRELFRLVGTFFKVILYLATDVTVIGDTQIEDFTSRIYMFLAIIMFFRIAISTIQYIVNPEELSNSDKGIGAIIKNTAIAIVLLVVVPEVFKFARSAQGDIAKFIPDIILGDKARNLDCNMNTSKGEIECQARKMSVTVLNTLVTNSDGGVASFNDVDDFWNNLNLNCENGSVIPTNLTPYLIGVGCRYYPRWLLLIVVGLFLVYIVASMAVDIAIRVFKFTLLELLAPIPIVSYINKAKGGPFESWLKQSKDVYIDLFIRLIVIYFIIFVLDILTTSFANNGLFKGELAGEDWLVKGLVLIFLVIGLLFFAKEAPKFICDLLGIKGTDSISGMFKRAGGLFGAGAAGLTAGYANLANARRGIKAMRKSDEYRNKSRGERTKKLMAALGRGIGSMVAGQSSAAFRGSRAALSGKSLKEAFSTGHKGAVTARQNRDIDRLNHINVVDRFRVRYQNALGLDTEESLAEAKQKAYSAVHQDVANYKQAILGRLKKHTYVTVRNELKVGSAIDRIGSMLNDAATSLAINNSGNEDLKNIRDRFEYDSATGAWRVKAGASFTFADFEAVRMDAESAGIGSLAAVVDVRADAEKELFADAMAGRVRDNRGQLVDEFNVGSDGYTAAQKATRKKAHPDVTTSLQTALQHLAENAVPLGESSTELQNWFRGVSTDPRHANQDFGDLDDAFQRQSEQLSSSMSQSKQHLARESLSRRQSNSSNNSGK